MVSSGARCAPPTGSGTMASITLSWRRSCAVIFSAVAASCALSALRHRIEALAATVPLEQTALLGFSQGAAMALDVATGGAAPLPLAALIACSGYPHRDWQPLQGGPPVLLTHGREDPVVAIHHCDALNQRLVAAGVPVNRRDFSGGHGIDPDLFPLMRHFLDAAWADRS